MRGSIPARFAIRVCRRPVASLALLVCWAFAAQPAAHAAPSTSPSPSDLVFSWSYSSITSDGSFRLYRSVGLAGFEVVAEVPVETGKAETSYVVRDARSDGAVYELRLVNRDGSEQVLARSVWTPRSLDVPMTVSSSSSAPGLASSEARLAAPDTVRPLEAVSPPAAAAFGVRPETPPPDVARV